MSKFNHLKASSVSKRIEERTKITIEQIHPLIETIVEKMISTSSRSISVPESDLRKFYKEHCIDISCINLFVSYMRDLGYNVRSGSQYNETHYSISIPDENL